MIRFLVGTVVLWFVIGIIMGATGIGAATGLDVDLQGWIAFIAAAVLMGIFSATRRGQSALKFDTAFSERSSADNPQQSHPAFGKETLMAEHSMEIHSTLEVHFYDQDSASCFFESTATSSKQQFGEILHF